MICPKCSQELVKKDGSFKCKNNHTYDITRQGYVNLSLKQKKGGDNKEMVQARTAFLEKDYYRFMKQKLQEILSQLKVHSYLDIGCGQGYYTKDLAAIATESYGIDLSKDAIQFAARQDKKTQYIVGSIYALPFKDHSLDCVTSIFTPIPEKELARVIEPGGYFISVSPAADHLLELKEQLYEQVYKNDETLKELPGFEIADHQIVTDKKLVHEVWDLFEMTPYRYKTSSAGMSRIQELDSLEITFSFLITIYKKL